MDCPIGDWWCPYYENGDCKLATAKEDCDAWDGLEES